MKWIFCVFVASCCLSACEKTVDIQPKNLETALVVDGRIETGQPPIIVLSNSLNYFSSVSAEILNNSQVHNAKITLSNGQKTHQLKEYTFPVGGGYTISYYSTDSSSLGSAIIGEFGKTYDLSIEVGGKKYTATTTIPLPNKKIDSLWWKPSVGSTDTVKVTVLGKFTDPPGFGDYIRYFTKINRDDFLPGANSVFDDQVVDGKTYEAQIDQGINRNDPPEFEDYGFFERGDTVTIKFCNIDKATFDFWRTLEYSYQAIGNPFSTPTTILNNVKGGLGAFCGYSVQYKSLIIPR